NLFAGVLVIQSLPFLAAAALAALEGSRVNDYVFWRRLETRLLPRLRPATIAQVAIAEAAKSSEKRNETAQESAGLPGAGILSRRPSQFRPAAPNKMFRPGSRRR